MKNLSLAVLLAAAPVVAQAEAVRSTVAFTQVDGQDVLMERWENAEAKSPLADGRRPVFIYVHGGGFVEGSRLNAQQDFYCLHFADNGYLTYSIDYPLSSSFDDIPQMQKSMEGAIDMLLLATQHILENEQHIDPSKVIVSGGSAGAMTVLGAEYSLCNGSTRKARLPQGFHYAGLISHDGCINTLESEIVWPTKPCPMLLMHGSVDTTVNAYVGQFKGYNTFGSSFLYDQLKGMRSPVWLYEEVGADHIVALKAMADNFFEFDLFLDKMVLRGQKHFVHTRWEENEPAKMMDEKGETRVDQLLKHVPLYTIGFNRTLEDTLKDMQQK